jgi:hypothetical protein
MTFYDEVRVDRIIPLYHLLSGVSTLNFSYSLIPLLITPVVDITGAAGRLIN